MGLNTALCCFFIEFAGRCLGQVGFMTQKLAIRDAEKKERGKAVEGVDDVNAGGQYLRCKWVFGFALVITCAVVQSAMLPFIDLTLVACNCATAILANLVLSVWILGEPFVWQYDVTAILLIVSGTLTIAIQSNTEQRENISDHFRERSQGRQLRDENDRIDLPAEPCIEENLSKDHSRAPQTSPGHYFQRHALGIGKIQIQQSKRKCEDVGFDRQD